MLGSLLTAAAGAAPSLEGCSAQSALTPVTQVAQVPARFAQRGSWMDDSASNGALIYIADSYENKVFVYSYPEPKLVGTLTGFSQPEGECVDASGDVWIANSGKSQVIEYAHGATAPKATLGDPNNFPYSCAVDPKTGDLAVVNLGHDPTPGGVSIYKNAQGSPEVYMDDSLYVPFFAAYDADGKLFVDGIRGFYYPDFALVRFYDKRFTNVELNHAIVAPGDVAVVGSRVEIGDAWRDARAVYGFTVKGLKGRLVCVTRLRRTSMLQEFAVVGDSLVAANIDQTVGSGMVFKYPKGGPPRAVFGKGTLVGPIGLAVSFPSRRNWMDPAARSKALVYISDAEPGAGTVYVFSYPRLKLVGTLTNFGQPLGECVDNAGDVWIADYSASKIYEYAHGASSPMATLNDSNHRPYSCAIDPRSGDLAVANIFGPGDGPGGLSIYEKARGRPKFYFGSSLYQSYFDAYDAHGDVYVDGLTQLYNGVFAMARFDGKRFTRLTLDRAVGYPGGVAVDGSNVNVGDQTYDANVVYQFSFTGSKGKTVGSTPLLGASDIRQFAIFKDSLVAGNGAYQGASGMVFSYPTGGSPKKTFGAGTFQVPFGAAVSR